MHVVVLGGGYAGVTLVRDLEQSLPTGVDITLVDERETHLVQHLVHRTIRKPDLADRLTVPFARLCTRAEHHQAQVTAFDREAQVIETTDGTLAYDLCAVALGAQTAFHGLAGVETHATPLKRLDHAARIREEFDAVREVGGRAVVCGAGLSGVQAAGELAELAATAGTEPEVVLVEQAGTVTPGFPEPFRAAVRDELDARGVDVRTGVTVEGATADELRLGAGGLPYDQLVWTGGITGRGSLGNRPEVRATLRLDDRGFALGDAARVVDADGTAVPATAQAAVEQAGTAATNIARLVEHIEGGGGFEPRLARYRHSSRGWVVSVGDGTVAQVGPQVLRGRSARALKATIGTSYLGSVGSISDAVRYAMTSV